jgi:hypothetical protein
MDAIQGEHPQLGMRNARAFMNSVIALCGPVFKHESFKEEKEWRLVVQCKARKNSQTPFPRSSIYLNSFHQA